MANETEVIREKMEATRNDLSDKIEKLEAQVVNTVQEASATVAEAVQGAKDVVETVKETMEEAAESVKDTVASVKDTMDNVTGAVGGAVEGVKETFSDAADSVRDTFSGAAESIRGAFDLPAQVDRHPWLMMGGAIVVGFAAGKLLDHAPDPSEFVHGAASSGGRLAQSFSQTAGTAASAASSVASAASGWMSTLESMFGPEISRLKEMAIGALVGVARDMAVKAAPDSMSQQVADLFDGVTSKLGGKPVEGSVLGPRPSDQEVHNGPERRF